MQIPVSSTSSPALVLSSLKERLLQLSESVWCGVLTWFWLTLSWMTANAKHLFMWLWVISTPSVEECLVREFPIYSSFVTVLWEFFMYSGYKSLVRYVWFTNIFSTLWSFHFAAQIFLILMISNLFLFFVTLFLVNSKKLLPHPRSWRFTPVFSSKSLWFQFFHFEWPILSEFLCMVQGGVPLHSFLCGCLVVQHHLL